MGSLLSSMRNPLWWQLLAHWQVQLRPWSLWLSSDLRMVWPDPENMLWRGCRWALSPFHHARLWWKRLFKAKGLPEEYKKSWTPGFLVLVFSSPAGSFQTEMSHLWLPSNCMEPHQSHQYYLSPWTGPEEEVKTPPPTGLRKLGFADRSFHQDCGKSLIYH